MVALLELVQDYIKRKKISVWVLGNLSSDWAKVLYILLTYVFGGIIWYRTTQTIMSIGK
jgi:hypothetical protein